MSSAAPRSDFALVMPMAGRGSRFAKLGIREPKPLIDLHGRPFFWWAVESVRRVAPLRELLFVVLEEHVRDWSIADRIHEHYPDARIIAIPDVTSGAAETARIGLDALATAGPVAINDCDHAFMCPAFADIGGRLGDDLAAALLCFRSDNPAYSYVRLDPQGRVAGTVEKRVESPFAIAGCYMFADPATFLDMYERYRAECPYDELFVSGLYNLLVDGGASVGMIEAERHISFGTPDELVAVTPARFAPFRSWA